MNTIIPKTPPTNLLTIVQQNPWKTTAAVASVLGSAIPCYITGNFDKWTYAAIGSIVTTALITVAEHCHAQKAPQPRMSPVPSTHTATPESWDDITTNPKEHTLTIKPTPAKGVFEFPRDTEKPTRIYTYTAHPVE